MSNYDFNLVVLNGRVGKDPVFSNNGKIAFATLSLAVNRTFNRGDEKVTEVNWHQLVFFGKLADIVKAHIGKGDKLLIKGELANSKWHDNDGKERITTQVIVDKLEFDSKRIGESDNINLSSETCTSDCLEDIPLQ